MRNDQVVNQQKLRDSPVSLPSNREAPRQGGTGHRAAVPPIGSGLLLGAASQLALAQFDQQVSDRIVGNFVYGDLALMANQHLL